MQKIEKSYTIAAPKDTVWRALIDPMIIEQWGAGPAVMSEETGSAFSLWDGDIYCTNTRVIPGELLEQDWYSDRTWTAPSKLSISLHSDGPESESTIVDLIQTDIPDDAAGDIEEGWSDYYFEPIRELLEEDDSEDEDE